MWEGIGGVFIRLGVGKRVFIMMGRSLDGVQWVIT